MLNTKLDVQRQQCAARLRELAMRAERGEFRAFAFVAVSAKDSGLFPLSFQTAENEVQLIGALEVLKLRLVAQTREVPQP